MQVHWMHSMIRNPYQVTNFLSTITQMVPNLNSLDKLISIGNKCTANAPTNEHTKIRLNRAIKLPRKAWSLGVLARDMVSCS